MKRRAPETRAQKTTSLPPSGRVASDARVARAEARAAEAEAALDATRARAAALVEYAPMPIFAKDAEGRYTVWNPACAADSRLPAEAVLGRTDHELFGPEIATHYQAQDGEVARSGVPRAYEVQLELPDGLHEHRVVKFAVPPSAGQEPEVYGIVLDETRERRLTADLLRSQRLESMGRLAAGMAHDLSNVLMALRGYVSLLEGEHRAKATEGPRELLGMHAAIDRGAALIRELLAFGRRPSSPPQLLVVDELVLELAPILERLVDEPVTLSLEIDDSLPLTVRADPLQLEQVIVNLVVNARDAIPGAGHIALSASVDGGCGALPSSVLVSVRDTGPGMDEATKARIFEPFFTTKGAVGGTGLGLATSLDMVTAAGGTLEVESAPGQGTTMMVRLPWVNDVPAPVRAVLPPEVPRGTEAVLLVDDDEAVRSVVARMLAMLGYRVTTAGGAEEALARAREGGFDLVVSDEALPGTPREILVARLREVAPTLPVLFVGTDPGTRAASALLEPGERVLVKPFDPRALGVAVRDRIDHGGAAKPTRCPPA